MLYLVTGILIFVGTHSISIFNEEWRNRTADKLSTPIWKGIYSVFSLIGFALICWGYGLARQDPIVLYQPLDLTRYLALLLMFFVFPLILAANFPGRIKTLTKHPLLAATKIWALSHLLTNGTIADVILFSSLLVWAILNRISLKKRNQTAMISPPEKPYNDLIVIGAGTGIYAVFVFWGHTALFSVPVIF